MGLFSHDEHDTGSGATGRTQSLEPSAREQIKKLCAEYGIELRFLQRGEGLGLFPVNVWPVTPHGTADKLLNELRKLVEDSGEMLLLKRELSELRGPYPPYPPGLG